MFNEDGSIFKFGQLHNNPYRYADAETQDITQELSDAIDNVCRVVDGAAVKPGSKWSRCEEWAYEAQDDSRLLIDCPFDCDPSDGGCISECGETCPYVQQDVNHLVFRLPPDVKGDDTLKMTYDTCSSGVHGIFEDCSDYGGGTVRNGFVFRTDPNPHSRDSLGGSPIITLVGKARPGKKAKVSKRMSRAARPYGTGARAGGSRISN